MLDFLKKRRVKTIIVTKSTCSQCGKTDQHLVCRECLGEACDTTERRTKRRLSEKESEEKTSFFPPNLTYDFFKREEEKIPFGSKFCPFCGIEKPFFSTSHAEDCPLYDSR